MSLQAGVFNPGGWPTPDEKVEAIRESLAARIRYVGPSPEYVLHVPCNHQTHLETAILQNLE
jgi:hypothetical protein